MKYDVVIVGAGPAGLFNAYELITNNPKLKIAILEKGFFVKKRVCPMIKQGVPCKNCNTFSLLHYFTVIFGLIYIVPVSLQTATTLNLPDLKQCTLPIASISAISVLIE